MKPTIGRIVHYVLGPWDGVHSHVVGEHRAAIVVKDWGGSVDLHVFLDGVNDAPPVLHHAPDADGGKIASVPTILHVTSILEGFHSGTWHWPEREEQPLSVFHVRELGDGPYRAAADSVASAGGNINVIQSGASLDREQRGNPGEERGSDPGSGSAESEPGSQESEPEPTEG